MTAAPRVVANQIVPSRRLSAVGWCTSVTVVCAIPLSAPKTSPVSVAARAVRDGVQLIEREIRAMPRAYVIHR